MTPAVSPFRESSAVLVITFLLKSKFIFLHPSIMVTKFCSLWNDQKAINAINETYEIDETIDAWNYRSHILLSELQDQVRRFDCSGGVWTQTTDVEGEVNGLMTYDRRLKRVDEKQWKDDIQGLYDAAERRRNATMIN